MEIIDLNCCRKREPEPSLKQPLEGCPSPSSGDGHEHQTRIAISPTDLDGLD
jgi:hypothetical protein